MGPTDPHVVGEWVSARARVDADHAAIVFGERVVTYRELDERSTALAVALTAHGLTLGSRVATLTENHPEHVALLFACAKAGLILFPMNWRLTNVELADQLDLVEPSLLVVSDAQRHRVDDALTSVCGEPLSLERLVDELDLKEAGRELPVVTGDDGLAIIATSGTTGRPKGVLLTHANFFWTNLGLDLAAPIASDDVVLAVLPEFHIGGWNVQPMLAWWKGATVVLESSFDAERVLERIRRHRVTTMAGVPTTFLLLGQAAGFPHADLTSLRRVVVGGAAMPITLVEEWHARNVGVVQGYGLTECAPNVFCLAPRDALTHPASVGHAYPYVDVALIDTHSGGTVEGAGRGELLVRGPNVFPGYWHNPEATREAFCNGWLRTGDVAERDASGYYSIVGRSKEMYVSGGENVYPTEVEHVLTSYPNVMNAAVVRVDHPTWGEAGMGFVEVRPGTHVDVDELFAHCRSRLATFKIPIRICVVAELPRTSVGKLDKSRLRSEALAEMSNGINALA